MTRCWRLLAVFSLLFVATVPLGLDVALDRSSMSDPVAAPVLAPKLTLNPAPLRYPSPLAPVWIPPPALRGPYPVAPGAIGLQRDVFQQLVHSAGMIFSGRVTFVGSAASSSGPAHASTTVSFQVEHGMRGVSTGQNLTIHEWSGLWSRGEHYRVGERVLLFLYAPSKLGLTSPVAGAVGRFDLDSTGKIVMSPHHIAIFNAADPILRGKTVVPYADFALAVRRALPRGVNQP